VYRTSKWHDGGVDVVNFILSGAPVGWMPMLAAEPETGVAE